ncbi:MAG: hypothetical protein R2752_02325 [Vicinamibacterales bacterium]
MSRTILRVFIAAALVGLGWTAGRAQGSGPDFEIAVKAPGGRTEVECVRGCKLAWVERMDPATITPNRTSFDYSCGAATCESGRIGGWIDR